MRPAQLLAAVVALSSVSAAWPDVFDSGNAMAQVNNMLYGRQDNPDQESEAPQPTNTARPSKTDEEQQPKSTNPSDENEDPKTTGKPSATDKPSDEESGTAKPSASKSAKPKSYDPRLPAGGISMITPAPMAGPQYYKIGEWVTLAWNYTSLSVTPSAIDVLATCTANQQTYTLAVNQSVEATGMVLWDTGAYQESAGVPLLTEKYTLIIYDSDSSVSAMPQAGYLGVYNQFTFGMYTPQPYVKWKDFKCANCNPNAGLSAFDSLTLKALLITSGTTEDPCEPWALLVGKTEDTDTSEGWCNIFREPFPYKDSDEHRPEELDTFLLQENLLSTVEGIKELDSGEQIREDDVGRINEEGSHETANTVAHEL